MQPTASVQSDRLSRIGLSPNVVAPRGSPVQLNLNRIIRPAREKAVPKKLSNNHSMEQVLRGLPRDPPPVHNV